MKRFRFALFVVMILLLPVVCMADLGFGTELVGNYAKWTKCCEFNNFDLSYSIHPSADDPEKMAIDSNMLTVTYNKSDMKAISAKLKCFEADGVSQKEQEDFAARLICFIGAIEYGNVETIQDIAQSTRVPEIMQSILASVTSNTVKIASGNEVFCLSGENADFYVGFDLDGIYIKATPLALHATDSANDPDPLVATRSWAKENGYDFPIYGSTSADLSPISDYLALLEKNSIYLKLPELNVSDNGDRDWIYSQIGDSFYLTYIVYHDEPKYTLQVEMPYTYKPREEAMKLLLVSVLSVEEQEAAKLLKDLQYNVIDQWCVIESDNYTIAYYEPRYSNGALADFSSLSVDKFLK